jgi:hypothetical protein
MRTATLALLALTLGHLPALAGSDRGSIRWGINGSSAGSDQVEFMGPSSDNEGSTVLGRDQFEELEGTENADTNSYHSARDWNRARGYKKEKRVAPPDDTPDVYTKDNSSSTSTDTSTNRSKAGQRDDSL